MADINKIQVGTTTYNINLLSTTNLSVASLNVTGTINGTNLNLGSNGTITAGTANLTVVKINGADQTFYKMRLSGEILYIESV